MPLRWRVWDLYTGVEMELVETGWGSVLLTSARTSSVRLAVEGRLCGDSEWEVRFDELPLGPWFVVVSIWRQTKGGGTGIGTRRGMLENSFPVWVRLIILLSHSLLRSSRACERREEEEARVPKVEKLSSSFRFFQPLEIESVKVIRIRFSPQLVEMA